MYVLEVISLKKYPVLIEPLTTEELNTITKKRYSFDWKKEKAYNLYKLTIVGQEDILGLISLEFLNAEFRIHVRLLAVSLENIGERKSFERIAGNLFAYASMMALKVYGENAAISLLPKTELGQYYMDEYGFEQAGKNLFMEGERLQKLFKKFE